MYMEIKTFSWMGGLPGKICLVPRRCGYLFRFLFSYLIWILVSLRFAYVGFESLCFSRGMAPYDVVGVGGEAVYFPLRCL